MPKSPEQSQGGVERFYSKPKTHEELVERFKTLVELPESPEHPKVIIKLDDPNALHKFVYMTDTEGREYVVALPMGRKVTTKYGVKKIAFHEDIASFINKLVQRETGGNVQIKKVNGGGHITTRGERLLIGGRSGDYGEAPKEEVARILNETFPELEIHFYPAEISPEKYLNDREALLDIAAVSPRWLTEFPPELIINDRELILEALKRKIPEDYDSALKYLPEEVRNNKEIVLVAVSNNWRALEYASEQLKNDRDVVLKAVRASGLALQYASEELRDDEEVVLTAVENEPNALFSASERLRDDKRIVLEAVRSNGWALQSASERLRDDEEIVLEAIKTNRDILENYASERLRNNPEFLRKVKEIQGEK